MKVGRAPKATAAMQKPRTGVRGLVLAGVWQDLQQLADILRIPVREALFFKKSININVLGFLFFFWGYVRGCILVMLSF